MKFEKNNWGFYEIDFYNDIKYDVKIKISKNLELNFDDVDDCYMLDNDWKKRSSGMVFNIKHLNYYPIIKKFLDNELKKFLRKEKLKKIDEESYL